jgi:hypothetical protein
MSEKLSVRPAPEGRILLTWEMSASDFCMTTEYLLRQEQYWAAEAVLKVFFLMDYGTNIEGVPSNKRFQEAWTAIQWFVEGPLGDGEQEIWAKMAILQTFCEGLLAFGRPAAKPGVACDWAFPKVISLLRNLSNEALSRDKTGDWSHSRVLIRYQLLDFDTDVADDAQRGDLILSRAMFDTLLRLCEDARDNQDLKMESSVHWRLQTLGFQEGPKATADPSLIPLKVYDQLEDALAEMKDSKYIRSFGRRHEWWPFPIKLIRTEEGELHGHESKSINEQGPPGTPSQDEEAGRAESVNSRDSSTETLLTPVENLWALLGLERQANLELRHEDQRLERSVAELTAKWHTRLQGEGEQLPWGLTRDLSGK